MRFVSLKERKSFPSFLFTLGWVANDVTLRVSEISFSTVMSPEPWADIWKFPSPEPWARGENFHVPELVSTLGLQTPSPSTEPRGPSRKLKFPSHDSLAAARRSCLILVLETVDCCCCGLAGPSYQVNYQDSRRPVPTSKTRFQPCSAI